MIGTPLDLDAPFDFAIIGIHDHEATRVHFGSVRFTDDFAVIHEIPGECCGDVLAVLVPIKAIDTVEVYHDAAALQKAVADQKIHIFSPEPPGMGMEVR